MLIHFYVRIKFKSFDFLSFKTEKFVIHDPQCHCVILELGFTLFRVNCPVNRNIMSI